MPAPSSLCFVLLWPEMPPCWDHPLCLCVLGASAVLAGPLRSEVVNGSSGGVPTSPGAMTSEELRMKASLSSSSPPAWFDGLQ